MSSDAANRAPILSAYWLRGGFRPFFFLGALAMALSVLVWLPFFAGAIQVSTAFAPRDWHIHTLLFGGLPAIIAGFALTAVANWTGRPPVQGGELLALVLLWLAGRLAVSLSAFTGPVLAAMIDLAFPAALTAVFAREVIGGKNARNLRVVALVALLTLADLGFHVEAAATGFADISARAGIALVMLLVLLIGGRIIPAFTRNWLKMRGADRLPAGFSRLDGATMAISTLAFLMWTASPEWLATALVLLLASIMNAVRMARWRGLATRNEPLLLVLHVAYATVPLGFLLIALSNLSPEILLPSAALHIWTAGTFGLITLAVMTRASRGHSGRPLAAGGLEIAMYALVLIGALSRVLAPYADARMMPVIDLAGLCWSGAFLAFAIGYGPMLLKAPRP
ncbi:NnrS family protein [Consotaella salsifontis]|uniref:Uncharacterized protein involved in response to NO n=1 Tax=Consotaella salsifontis TaxID=1365950 RepID=A0A1T4NIF9_9HYPH|nr:NnrS family protein [Consotaella salsifontis]SJZ79049.1 uncharacterized protein involved in response to NO [Consotaella salsifontis]